MTEHIIINKYKCDKCKFECKNMSKWNAHLNTEKHKTEKRKKRSDVKEPLICNKCEYKTKK